MRHANEYSLLQKVAAGDSEAFRIVYIHYSPCIYSFIRKYLRSPELSDDVCQNVFIKIWEQRSQLSSVMEFSAWAFTIAKRQCLDFLKKAACEHSAMSVVLQSYPCTARDCENDYQEHEYMQFISKVLSRMPLQTQLVFRLCRQQCKSYDEAARELGITRNAIKKHMVRSVRILRQAAEKELGISFSIFLLLVGSRL